MNVRELKKIIKEELKLVLEEEPIPLPDEANQITAKAQLGAEPAFIVLSQYLKNVLGNASSEVLQTNIIKSGSVKKTMTTPNLSLTAKLPLDYIKNKWRELTSEPSFNEIVEKIKQESSTILLRNGWSVIDSKKLFKAIVESISGWNRPRTGNILRGIVENY